MSMYVDEINFVCSGVSLKRAIIHLMCYLILIKKSKNSLTGKTAEKGGITANNWTKIIYSS